MPLRRLVCTNSCLSCGTWDVSFFYALLKWHVSSFCASTSYRDPTFTRGRLITLENGKQIWISFKYERLPNLCYWCGCLTHDNKDCETWIDSEGTLKLKDRQFGPGLWALAFVSARTMGMIVPGYYTSRKKIWIYHSILTYGCRGECQLGSIADDT